MSLTIETNVTGVGQLLQSSLLQVPLHQRSFAWGAEEVSQLWEDLMRSHIDEPEGYFIGPIVLGQPSDNEQRLSVIDGQQRLATTSLLFAAMAAEFKHRADNERASLLDHRYLCDKDIKSLEREPKLVLSEDDDTFFTELLSAAATGGDLPSPDARKPSQSLLKKAYELLRGRIELLAKGAGASWQEGLLGLQSFIDDSVEVILVKVGSDQNAYLIFETLNDRGLRLTTSDLLKNHLFGQADRHIDAVRQAWTEMTSSLSAIGSEDPTPQFLRHFWISTKEMVREKELYKKISGGIRTPGAAVKFAEGLAITSERYSSLTNPSHPAWHDTKTRNALNVLQLFRVTTPRPLLLAALEVYDENLFSKVVQAIARWSIRLAISGGLGSGAVEEAYGDAGRRIRKGEMATVDDLKRILTPVLPNDETFRAAFSTKILKNRRQCRFLLAALEKQARLKQDRTKELSPNLDEGEVNLEHIMPHNPGPGTWDHIRPDDRAFYIERLGNMALMLTKENLAAGAADFATKKPYFERSELVLTAELSEFTEWSTENISKRQIVMADLAIKCWPV